MIANESGIDRFNLPIDGFQVSVTELEEMIQASIGEIACFSFKCLNNRQKQDVFFLYGAIIEVRQMDCDELLGWPEPGYMEAGTLIVKIQIPENIRRFDQ